MSRVTVNGKDITAPKWMAIMVPVVVGILASAISVLATLAAAVTDGELQSAISRQERTLAESIAAMERRIDTMIAAEERVIVERWAGHNIMHGTQREYIDAQLQAIRIGIEELKRRVPP